MVFRNDLRNLLGFVAGVLFSPNIFQSVVGQHCCGSERVKKTFSFFNFCGHALLFFAVAFQSSAGASKTAGLLLLASTSSPSLSPSSSSASRSRFFLPLVAAFFLPAPLLVLCDSDW